MVTREFGFTYCGTYSKQNSKFLGIVAWLVHIRIQLFDGKPRGVNPPPPRLESTHSHFVQVATPKAFQDYKQN